MDDYCDPNIEYVNYVNLVTCFFLLDVYEWVYKMGFTNDSEVFLSNYIDHSNYEEFYSDEYKHRMREAIPQGIIPEEFAKTLIQEWIEKGCPKNLN